MNFRFELGLKEKVQCITPKPLSDADIAGVTVKRAQLGAIFMDNMSKLPTVAGKIYWEVEVAPTPPAHLKATKPKFWINGNAKLEKGFYYKLAP